MRVSGIFKAQGGEQYLTLGNFKDDVNTAFAIVRPTGYYGAVYYGDDVAVYALDSMPLKADAGRDTTIHIGDSAFIGSLTNGIDSIKWQVLNANGTIDSIRSGFWVHPTINTCYVLIQTVNGFTSSDTVCVNVLPLPLKFISFTAQLQPTPNPSKEGNVKLDWVTVNEINVSYFYVQRSSGNPAGQQGRDFQIIGKVNANGANYNEYSFIYDFNGLLPSPLGEGVRLYYRIVSVDKDGKTNFSEVKQISISKEQVAISIYPNPTKDVVNIRCKGMKEVRVINQLGQVVYKEIASSLAMTGSGTNLRNDVLTINTKQFTKGLYIVQVTTTNGEVKTQKLIVE